MNSNYNIIRIQRYLQGELSPEEMYELERQALDDPFLNDAIEGYRLQKEINHGKLSLLQQRLAQRIEGQRKERESFFSSGQRLGVAATACVLFVLVVVLLWMKANMSEERAREMSLAETEIDLTDLQSGLIDHVVRIQANPTLQAESGMMLTPLGGWEAFDEYLNSHFSMTNGSEIEVSDLIMMEASFVVDLFGQPNKIQLYEAEQGSLTEAQRNELIQLLENGPAWEGPSQTMQLTLFIK